MQPAAPRVRPPSGIRISGPPSDPSAPTLTMDFDARPAVATILGVDDVADVDLPETLVHSDRSPRSSGRLKTIAQTGKVDAAAITAGQAGKYEIHGEMARGGMGAILRGFDRDIRREIAMKVLLNEQPKKMTIARFLEEAQVTGQLEHPNIVPVHEVGVDDASRLYFTMKLVRGRSLKERTEAARRDVQKGRGDHAFPLHQRIDVFRKICDAIAFAHSRGVIHRDLKPENVMLGEFGEVQVMDWGIARVTGRPDRRSDHVVITDRSEDGIARTMDGAVAGTPAYMSPEQAKGELKKIDARSDVFSLGAILFEMLTFTPPYRGKSVWDVLEQARKAKVEAPTDRVAREYADVRGAGAGSTRRSAVDARLATSGGPLVPRELEAVVLKAMDPHQAKRYRSVRDLRGDVDAWLEGRTLQAADYTSWQLVSKWIQRHKAAAIGAAATFLVAVAGIVALVLMDRAAVERQAKAVAEAAVEADQTARAEEAERAREQREQRAEREWQAALGELNEAQNVPFNPASPQNWYLARLPAARRMGRALQTHPQPPARWKEQLADVCLDLQTRAEEVGDWALALHVAGSAYDWGAVDEATRDERLAQVEREREARADADVERLERILQIIRRAETGTSGGMPPDEGSRKLAPGEIDERARQAAAIASPDITRVALARIIRDLALRSDSAATDMTPSERLFTIRLLGLRGDIHVEADGQRLPDVVREVLDAPPGWMDMDEVLAWLWTAARLEARHGCFGVRSMYDLLPRSFANESSLYAAEIDRADQWLRLATGMAGRLDAPSEHPQDPMLDEPEFRSLVQSLGDHVASAARSGSDYTRELLERARSGQDGAGNDLSARQLAFVLDQIGLHGDVRPPEPDQPDLAAVPVLREHFEAVPDEWLGDRRPVNAPEDAWIDKRFAAISAALNLARLDDVESSRRLWERRRTAGQHSAFALRTRLPMALLPTAGLPPVDPVDGDGSGGPSGVPDSPGLEDLLARGSHASERGDWTAAIDAYTEALELDPDNLRALSGRAFNCMRAGRLREALEAYNRAIELNPGNAALYTSRAGIWLRTNRPDLARADYDRSLRLDPTLVEAWINRSTLRGNQGDLQGAMDDLQQALKLNPRLSQAWVNLGVVRARVSDTERDPARKQALLRDALDAFDNAARLSPENSGIFASRASCKMRLNDLAGAVVDLDRAIRLDPANASARMMRGDCHQRIARTLPAGQEQQTMYQRALADYREAARLDPGDAESRANAAAILMNFNQPADARDLLQEALRINPQHWMAWMYTGILLGRSGDRAGATRAFDNASRFAPAAYRSLVQQYRRQVLGD